MDNQKRKKMQQQRLSATVMNAFVPLYSHTSCTRASDVLESQQFRVNIHTYTMQTLKQRAHPTIKMMMHLCFQSTANSKIPFKEIK